MAGVALSEVDTLASNAAALLAGWGRDEVEPEAWGQAWALIKQMYALDQKRAYRAAELWGSMFGTWWRKGRRE